jgi:uncharacterized protein YegP (UPF0339 family)
MAHKILVYRDASGKRWRYRVKAGNHKVVDDSEQGFRSKWYAIRKAKRAWPDGVVEVES